MNKSPSNFWSWKTIRFENHFFLKWKYIKAIHVKLVNYAVFIFLIPQIHGTDKFWIKFLNLNTWFTPPKIIISPDWQKSIIKFPIQETIIQNYVFPLRNEFQKRKFLWKKDHPGFSKEKIPIYTFVHTRKWVWEDFLCVKYNKVLRVWFLRIHALYIQVIWFISSGKAGKTTSVCFIKLFPVPR